MRALDETECIDATPFLASIGASSLFCCAIWHEPLPKIVCYHLGASPKKLELVLCKADEDKALQS